MTAGTNCAELHWPAMGDWYTIGILRSGSARRSASRCAGVSRARCSRSSSQRRSRASRRLLASAVGRGGRRARRRALCGALGAAPLVAGALRRGGTRGGTALILLGSRRSSARRSRSSRGRLPRGAGGPAPRRAPPPPGARHARGSAHARAGLDEADEARRPGRDRRPDAVDVRELPTTPALALPRRARRVPRAASTFPSLTPVCLSSIATGAHPDVHEIPHLVWWHRGEQRLVEYGSSFGAVRAAGLARVAPRHDRRPERDSTSRTDAETVYEALEDAGLTTAAINITCYRGAHRHLPTIPGVPGRLRPEAVLLLLPLRERPDRRAARGAQPRARLDRRVRRHGRPLARHARRLRPPRLLPARTTTTPRTRSGPTARTRRSRAATPRSRALIDAAGGPDEFLDRYAVVVCSDHGQSTRRAVGASSTSATTSSPPRTAPRWSTPTTPRGSPSGSTREPRRRGRALPRGRRASVARRDGDEDLGAARRRARRAARAPRPRCATRTPARCSSRPRRAGSSPTSAAGTISAAAATARSTPADSEVPMLTVGLGAPPASITGIKASWRALRSAGARAACTPRDWVDGQLRRRGHRRRARARGDGARAARAVRPEQARAHAYEDAARSVRRATISQPFIVACICQGLALGGDERVLDVGTGSGYQAAVLAELAGRSSRSSGSPSSRPAPGGARRCGLPTSRCTSATAARRARARALRRDRGRGGPGGRRRACSRSSRPADASWFRSDASACSV